MAEVTGGGEQGSERDNGAFPTLLKIENHELSLYVV